MNIKVITGLVKLADVHIFEPYSPEGVEGYEPRYSTTIIIQKCDDETLKAIEAPLRDGDIERPGDPLYKDCYFLNANSKNKPGVVDANVQPILDAKEVYSGCYAKVSIEFYSYNVNGNKGVAAGLNNVQLIGSFL